MGLNLACELCEAGALFCEDLKGHTRSRPWRSNNWSPTGQSASVRSGSNELCRGTRRIKVQTSTNSDQTRILLLWLAAKL